MEELNLDGLSLDIDAILDPDYTPDESIEEGNQEDDIIEEQPITEEEENEPNPESVGSDEDPKEGENTESGESSPNFYSSIATALSADGILPDLDEETLKGVTSAEGFYNVIQNHIKSQLDEIQKRVTEALEYQVHPTDIQKYEGAIQYLDSLDDSAISDESEEGNELRKNLILQDYINRGYSKERAEREVKKSLDSGSDIEDAKEAKQSLSEFYKNSYKQLIETNKKEQQELEAKRKEDFEKLKTSILDDSEMTKELGIDKSVRQKAYDNLSKQMYKDEETGQMLTLMQKAQKDNPIEYFRGIALAFTLTDGFKDFKKLIKGPVKKEVKTKLSELEKKLTGSSFPTGGNLSLVHGNKDQSSTKFEIDI